MVTITGTGFDKDVGGVNFGANAAKVSSRSYKELKVVTPKGADVNSLVVGITITGL